MDSAREGHEEIKEKVERLFDKEKAPRLNREMQQVYEKHQFVNEVYNNPVENNHYDTSVNFEQINLQDFINLRLFPRSIYVTDHLIRLAVNQRFEALKKFLPKKRRLAFDGWWILLLLVAGVCVVLLILMLVPGLLGGIDLGGLMP